MCLFNFFHLLYVQQQSNTTENAPKQQLCTENVSYFLYAAFFLVQYSSIYMYAPLYKKITFDLEIRSAKSKQCINKTES